MNGNVCFEYKSVQEELSGSCGYGTEKGLAAFSEKRVRFLLYLFTATHVNVGMNFMRELCI